MPPTENNSPPHDSRAASPAEKPAAAIDPKGRDAFEQKSSPKRPRTWWRRAALAAVAVALLFAGLLYGVPWLEKYFTRVSTDDAYVSGYVTYLGPRIASRVDGVFEQEDDFFRRGETLVRLDPEPFRVAVDQAEANLQLAQANVAQAQAGVHAQLVTARANEYQARSAADEMHYRIASLQAAIAQLKLDESKLALAEKDFSRVAGLVERGAESKEDYEQRQANLQVARDQVNSQREVVQQARAHLGLPRNTESPGDIPKDLESQYAMVQTARANWASPLVQLGIPLTIVGLNPQALSDKLRSWLSAVGPQTEATEILRKAPSLLLAEAGLKQAQAALEQARLNLSYTEIKAPFDGFVTKRTVNPGDYAAPGQNLLAVQSLRDVWVEANFKETVIQDLRIGMPADIYVDAYPDKVFKGHVSGLRPATGARLALLPPENATGNFVKIVQRLPVRIDFDQPPPTQTPLFVGLSVEPEVRFRAPASGPHAGERLRLPQPGAWPTREPETATAISSAAAGASQGAPP